MNFLCQNFSESFYFFFIEQYQFRGTFFAIDVFGRHQFLKHVIFLNCAHFLSADFGLLVRYENDLKVIFDQWPKFLSVLHVRPEFQS